MHIYKSMAYGPMLSMLHDGNFRSVHWNLPNTPNILEYKEIKMFLNTLINAPMYLSTIVSKFCPTLNTVWCGPCGVESVVWTLWCGECVV